MSTLLRSVSGVWSTLPLPYLISHSFKHSISNVDLSNHLVLFIT